MSTTSDVVVIGSGINGLVAAAKLAGAGLSVTLVERNSQVGGFIASGELTEPGYTHDTFSSWHPLFVTSPAYAELSDDLARHGLAYANTDGPLTASIADDGAVSLAHRDPAVTAAGFAHPEDGEAYLAMLDRLGVDLDQVGALLASELRSLRAARPLLTMLRAGGPERLEGWARATASSGRAFTRSTFTGHEVDHLWAPWLLHAGLSPDHASGGLMVPLFAGTMHAAGLPVVIGGAGRFVAAFERLLHERGVEILTDTAVDRVLVEGGRAVGVSAAGRTLRARRAVIASVGPRALYEQLLDDDAAPAAARADAAAYRYGRAAMQVHVALSGPVPWSDERLRDVPLVHVSSGSPSTGVACAEAEAGLLPARPTVVVGQQCVLDPSRAPEGSSTLWLQLQELPRTPSGDAADVIETHGTWDSALAESFADRALARVADHAPGLVDLVVGRRVISPADLEAHNPNAVGGDPYGGSAELDQNLLWRPGPASARHRTDVEGLWHIGAATHPGPGLGGGSGFLVAEELLRPPVTARISARARSIVGSLTGGASR